VTSLFGDVLVGPSFRRRLNHPAAGLAIHLTMIVVAGPGTAANRPTNGNAAAGQTPQYLPVCSAGIRMRSMDESEIYRRQNFGNSSGFGARPALLIVDFVNGFADPDNFGGGNIAAAIERTVTLLAACRRMRLPIATTRVVYPVDATADDWVFARKAPGLLALTETASASQIVAALAPVAGEYVVRKRMASAFFRDRPSRLAGCASGRYRARPRAVRPRAACAPRRSMRCSIISARSSCATASATARSAHMRRIYSTWRRNTPMS